MQQGAWQLVIGLVLGTGAAALLLGVIAAAALQNILFKVKPLDPFIYLVVSALLTAVAVAVSGVIGFVGLVVPHIARLTWGHRHRALLPAAFLGGGALLAVADTLARTVVAPRELPVGVVTALIGVPVFTLLLRRWSIG